jgi:hypothetical protein
VCVCVCVRNILLCSYVLHIETTLKWVRHGFVSPTRPSADHRVHLECKSLAVLTDANTDNLPLHDLLVLAPDLVPFHNLDFHQIG